MPVRIAGKYEICRLLGRGAFGELYQGTNMSTKEEVAIKLEKALTDTPMLQFEANVYKHLQGNPGIPTLYHSGNEDDYYVLVMEILGPSIQ